MPMEDHMATEAMMEDGAAMHDDAMMEDGAAMMDDGGDTMS